VVLKTKDERRGIPAVDGGRPIEYRFGTKGFPRGIPGRWPDPRESLAVLCLLLLYAFSFTLASPVNGLRPTKEFPLEVFDQDSRYIIEALADGKRFEWNPQHHLLYHASTEYIYGRLVRPHVRHGLRSVYLFLKGFTVLTGAAFLVLLSLLLREAGLEPVPRAVLLSLSGVSVSAWFNFSAFEAHSLGMAGIALYLLALVRWTLHGRFGLREQFMLGGSLAFLFLCRLDLVRFFAATALLIPFPPFRADRRRLVAVLAIASLAAGALYLPQASKYLEIPLRDAPETLLQREDDTERLKSLGTFDNFTAANLKRMLLATTVGTVIMPTGKEKFREPLEGVSRHPSFAAALALYSLLAAYALFRCVRNSVPLSVCILANWAAGIGLYTWFNPQEPFIWLLEFLPLLALLLGNGLKTGGRVPWILAAAATFAVLVHNTLFFLLPYRG